MKWATEHATTPLREEADALNKRELSGLNHPVSPITSISKSVMALRENSVAVRNILLLPWIVGMFIVLYLQADEIYRAWKAEERGISHELKVEEEIHGIDYFEITTDPYVLKRLAVIENGKISFQTYMTQMRYSEDWYADPQGTFEIDVIRTSIAVFLIIVLGTLAIRQKRLAPLFVDRDRRILYTWRKGQVWAQRYEKLHFYSCIQNVQLMLHALNPEGSEKPLFWMRYFIQPGGNPYFIPESLRLDALAAIVKFVEQGQQAVWPEDWQGDRPFYFFDDKKPDDFDEQLVLILQKIDEKA